MIKIQQKVSFFKFKMQTSPGLICLKFYVDLITISCDRQEKTPGG